MFGLKTIREKDYDALKEELKGFYAQSDMVNDYLRIIEPQLKGLEMPRLGDFSRDAIRKAYETIAPVMGVINYIADNVGEVARYLELRDRASGDYISRHWLLDVLNHPNDRYTRRKFLTAWAVNRLLFGDAFVYAPIQPGKDRNVREMYVIPGQRVMIERGGLTAPFKGIRLTGGVDGEIDMEGNVFESFDYNLDDTSFYGTSKVVASAVYLSVIERSMGRQATTLTNGGVANIITPANTATPPLPSQIDDLEEKANRKSNANRNIAMRMAIDVHKLGDNPVSLSILDSHRDAINALCFVFKLPVDLYLGQAKYENAKEAKKTIYEQMAIPMANEFAEDLLHYLRMDDRFELLVNTDRIEVLQESRTDVLTNLGKMYATLNELREANNYEPIEEEWANRPIVPMGVQFGYEAGDNLDFGEE